MQILEIGCGNAAFWKSTASLIPEKLEIHLTDYSEGLSGNSEMSWAIFSPGLNGGNRRMTFLYQMPDWYMIMLRPTHKEATEILLKDKMNKAC